MIQAFLASILDDGGTTAIEYSLLASLAAIACIGALMNFSAGMGILYTVIDAIAAVL